ncbi:MULTISPECIES: hypothetical protein [Rufibacter]|uniref:Rod shape-determining protein MreD n=1 Tax=Rufibacter quisquiliarum TaxID=1549639 RepID=A0A839GWK3_9BACT|nr:MULTISPECIES: hypothetical protein [Rufibacter]MBA9078121.1 hypothetical protein [Rufibacter quisquiliarum]
MNSFRFIHLVQFVVLMGLQILLMRNLVLYDRGFCFVYIGFILFLPIDIDKVLLLILAFMSGITIDLFYDTAGMHAAATVLMAYLRPSMLKLLTPRDGYEVSDNASLTSMGWRWFLTYAMVLIFVHHFTLFFLELNGFKLIGFTLAKIIISTLFTGAVLVIFQMLFFERRARGFR